ncbi:S8 family serine peptidase [Paenibacillus sp. ISL-20]|uniref:S8 family serine peptidase n=1 Tax=Paenibacillus sp. ISL-20 TaxID=2819163 RepID=UPI001BE8E613|nr:S8 family serine peptidase [Paenibacillus sp. ISL-20]MBT2763291.1 S8 family serine peptidase [Paenibacillus sp. ISL-20]
MSKKLWSALLSFILMLSLIAPAAEAAPAERQIELGNQLSADEARQLKDILKQRAKLAEFPNLDQSLQKSAGGPTRVIVELSTEPVALAKGLSSIQGQSFSSSAEAKVEAQVQLEQQTFIRSLDTKNISHEISNQYSYAFNGVSMEIDGSKVEALLDIPGVLGVYPDLEVTVGPKGEVNPYMKDTGPFIGAPEVWDLGYTGKGIKVGVIDTGIDYVHPVLKDAYKGGYDFVDNDNDPYETTPLDWENDPSNPPQVDDRGSMYWTDHGTHVAGTIGARDVGEYGVVGIAPGADIYAYRVLGPYGSGYSSWVLGGIDRSVQDGMDVINLSLGNSRNDPDYVTSVALNNAALAGVTPVVASGNTGPNRWTVGAPGAAAFPITVGNSTGPSDEIAATSHFLTDTELPGEPINNNDGRLKPGTEPTQPVTPEVQSDLGAQSDEAFGPTSTEDARPIDKSAQAALTDDTAAIDGTEPSVDTEQDLKPVQSGDGAEEEPVTDEVPVESVKDVEVPPADDVTPITVVDATYKLELMAWNLAEDPEVVLDGDFGLFYADLGKPEDFADKDVAGKIALIKRGELAFVDKIANAKAAGATGVIVFNQNPGPIGVLLGDSFSFIPTFSMSKEDGDYIKSLLNANPDLKVKFSDFIKNRTAGDEINDSSSRGPAKKTLDIKPDVVAPGTSILSSVPAYGKDIADADYSQSYDRLTGTSMASPHVAGLAALILEKHNDWTPFDVKVALMNNAKVLNTESYDVTDQGAGRVQALNTIQAEALVKVLDKTSYQENGTSKEQDNITGSINFGNFTGATAQTVQKKIKVEQIGDIGGQFEVEVSTTQSTPEVAVTVDQPSFDLSGEKELVVTLQVPAGVSGVSEQQGYIIFKNDTRTYSVPYVAYFNLEMTGVKYTKVYSETENYLAHFPLNEQGELGELSVGFEFYNPMGIVIVDLYDSLHPESGPDQDGVIGQIFGTDEYLFNANTEYTLDWDGEYHNYSSEEIEEVKDGLYSVELRSLGTNGNIYSDYATIPFFVKRTAPEIKTELDVKISGKNNPALTGKVDDLYVTAVPAMWDEWAIDFDVSEWLDATYVIKRANKTVAKEGSFDVEQDGSFNIALDGLSSGNYTVELSVKDHQGLQGKASVSLQLTGAPGPGNPDPGNPGGGSGGGGGGGSSSGGGSTGTPSTPAPEVSGDAKVTTKKNADGTESATAALSEAAVTAGITGDGKEVKLDVSKLDFSKYSDVALTLGKATVDKLKASGKPLVITGNGFSLTVPADALDDFTTSSGFSLAVSVTASKGGAAAGSLNAVSPIVSVKHGDKFKHPLLLTLNYDPTKVKDSRKVGAYLQSEQGDLQSAGLLQSAARGSITFRVNGPGSYVAAENNVTFNDIVSHWAKDEIEVAASQHITNGTGAGRFSPNNAVTRAEFATLLDRIFETGIDWETRSKEAGAKNPLTREDMVVMIAEALKIDSDTGSLSFSDTNLISEDARAAVAFAVNKGLVKGVNGNRFAPGETSTRAQVSVIVYRLLDYLNKI